MYTEPCEMNEEEVRVSLDNIGADLAEGHKIGDKVTLTVTGTVRSYSVSDSEHPYNCLSIAAKTLQIENGEMTVFEELSNED